MTLQNFIEKWNGQYCEVAGSANAQNQCVDLANAYIRDVLNLPIIEWTNAKDFPSKAGDKYDYILNTQTGVPQEGDLVIWGGTTAGHIAIFIEGNANSFRSLDQNYPTGSPVHVQNHTTYNNVLGWLHPKGTQVTIDGATFENLVTKATITDEVANLLKVPVNKEVIIGEIKKFISYEDSLIKKDKQLTEAQTRIADLENKLTNLSFEHTELIGDYVNIQEKVKDYELKMNDQGLQIKSLSDAIQELKKASQTTLNGWELIAKGLKKLLGGE